MSTSGCSDTVPGEGPPAGSLGQRPPGRPVQECRDIGAAQNPRHFRTARYRTGASPGQWEAMAPPGRSHEGSHRIGAEGPSNGRLQCWTRRPGRVAIPGAGCRVPGAGCRVPGAGCRVPGAGCRVPGAGCRVRRRDAPTGRGAAGLLVAEVGTPVAPRGPRGHPRTRGGGGRGSTRRRSIQPAPAAGMPAPRHRAQPRCFTCASTSRAARSPVAMAPCTVPSSPSVFVASPAKNRVPSTGVASASTASTAPEGMTA